MFICLFLYVIASYIQYNIPNYRRPTPILPKQHAPISPKRMRRDVPEVGIYYVRIELEIGLYKTCMIFQDPDVCHPYTDKAFKTDKRVVGVWIFIILAMILSLLAFILELASLRYDKIRSKHVGGVLVSAFIFGIIAMVLYTDFQGNLNDMLAREKGIKITIVDEALKLTYGWPYGLGWFATITALISSILAFVADDTCFSLCSGTVV